MNSNYPDRSLSDFGGSNTLTLHSDAQ